MLRNLLSLLLLFSLYTSFSQEWLNEYLKDQTEPDEELDFYDIQRWANEHFEQTEAEINNQQRKGIIVQETSGKPYADYIKYKRWEWYWSSRVDANGHITGPSNEAFKSYKRAKKIQKGRQQRPGDIWTSIAFETNSGGYWGMGKADCMGQHPTNPNIFYVGSDGGGIFKTTDGGNSYTAVGDDLPITQIAAILVDFNNPNTVYAALSPRGGWWNRSMGVYKSTDAGDTWSPTDFSYDYADGKVIYDMIMSETDPQTLLVARADGIWRTTNGGDSWTRPYTSDCNDLAWKPGDANVVYAARNDYWGSSEVLVSNNAGASWSQLTDRNLQKNSIKLAVTPGNPNIIAYASSIENNSLYISTDNGNSFNFKSNVPFGGWPAFISAYNTNYVYSGGIHVERSTDGGINWAQFTNWHGGGNLPEVHADVRNMYHSKTESGVIYHCNDGGIFKHNEISDTWTELTDGLIITQYYRGAVAQTDENICIAGSQDNGGSRRRSNGTWYNTNGGDAMEQAIDPTDANIMYTTYINGQLYRSMDGWTGDAYNDISANIPGGKPSGEWVAPYVLDPSNPSTIVAGYNDVYRSTNRGDSWTKISNNLAGGNIRNVAVAPSNSNIIYCSRGNVVYKTVNLGATWTSATLSGSEGISRIAIHESDPNTVWVSRDGWTSGEKVYKTTNGGSSWTNVSGTLPNIPTNCITFETAISEGVYVGNDFGVYYRDKNMSDWILYSGGLPNTKVTDLDIQYSGKKIRAATYGRGMWEAPLYDQSVVIIEDCHGDLGGSASIDACGYCSGGNTGVEPESKCCNPNGRLTIEQWNGISGDEVALIPITTAPDETYTLPELDHDLVGVDAVGTRVKALLCVPVTGNYTFWIASDDQGMLFLSTDEYADNKNLIAQVTGWTTYQDYDANASQQSTTILLEEGKQYYLELLHKEGAGGAHFSVAWQIPGEQRKILSAAFLTQIPDCSGEIGGRASIDDCQICSGGSTGITPNSSCCNAGGSINAQLWQNISGNSTDDIPTETTSTFQFELSGFLDTLFDDATDNFGVQVKGLLCPPSDGAYTFWIASDDNGKLILSSDDRPNFKTTIASVSDWTSFQNFEQYPSQESLPIQLEAGKQYYFEILLKEGIGGAHFSIAWQRPGSNSRELLPVSFLTDYVDCHTTLNGNAYVDSCGVCAGGSTGLIANHSGVGCVTSNNEQYKTEYPFIVPNPAKSQFQLKGIKGYFEIINSKGISVKSFQVTDNTSISIEGLPKGIYIVRTIDQDSDFVQHLIIE